MVSADSIQAPVPDAETPENPFDFAAIPPPLPSSPHALISSSPPPLSPRDQTLLQFLLTLRLDFTAFALKENLPADQLIDWAESAAIAPRLQSLRRLANLSLDIRHTQARRAAVDILESIATTAEDPIEKRRAASALLRRPEAPTRSASPSSPAGGGPAALGGGGGSVARALPTNAPDSLPRNSGPKTSSFPGPLYFPSMLQPPPAPDEDAESIAHRTSHALLVGESPQALANIFALLAPGADICGKPAPPTIPEFIASHADCAAARLPHPRKLKDTLCRHERTTEAGELYAISANPGHPDEQALLITISPRLGRNYITAIHPARYHPDPPAPERATDLGGFEPKSVLPSNQSPMSNPPALNSS